MQKNRLAAFLDEYFPEYQGVFKDLLGKAIMVYIKPFAFSQRHKGKEHRATDRAFNRVGEKRATKLKEAAQESIGVEEGLETARVRLKSILREFEFYNQELETINQKMERALQRTRLKDIILSIPGIWVVTAAGF